MKIFNLYILSCLFLLFFVYGCSSLEDDITTSEKNKKTFFEEAMEEDAPSDRLESVKEISTKEFNDACKTEVDLDKNLCSQRHELVLGEFSSFNQNNVLIKNQIITRSEEECHEVIKYKILELREKGYTSITPETRRLYGSTAHLCTRNPDDIKYFVKLYTYKKKQSFAYFVLKIVMLGKEFPMLVVIPHMTISRATCNSLLSMMSSQAICVPNNDD